MAESSPVSVHPPEKRPEENPFAHFPGNLPETGGETSRRFPIGAEVRPRGVHFRVWAPDSANVTVELYHPDKMMVQIPLEAEGNGYHCGLAAQARVGLWYRFGVKDGLFPDPASRFQPQGPHGPSEVIDASTFSWTDQDWRGRATEELVIYELHLGTFTAEGTWPAAQAQLSELKRVGITMVEVMPIAGFAGSFGWGYDGVNLFAPSHLYGRPDEVRAFVNRAHELGLMVILDVVYNHLGPDGNFLKKFAADYFNAAQTTEWGEAINFDGANAGPVREFYVNNARYWIEEFHLDGLRLDATQQIFDESPRHILAEIAEAAKMAGRGRKIYVVAENEPQHAKLVRSPAQGGYGLDALWNDDFHHSAAVAASGRSRAYYSNHRGSAQEFISALKHGFLYQGQWYHWQRQRRGTPAWDLVPGQFVVFIENHDQVANSLRGQRLHQVASPGNFRALTAMTLLAPQTPMLFQGQEFSSSAPFLYFADHESELRTLVRQGRRDFMEQFPNIAAAECSTVLADPGERATFERCKLDFADRERNQAAYRLHQDLLRLRHAEPAIHAPRAVDGAVLGPDAFVLRYFATTGHDRLLVVNLGPDFLLSPAPEPLLAPPEGLGWQMQWSSESTAYGGDGTPPIDNSLGWALPARTAFLLQPGEDRKPPEIIFHESH